MVEGTVENIETFGTIVQVFIRKEGGGIQAIPFDHRMFWHFYEAEGPLKGRVLRFDGETVEVLE